jgi:MFS family permease
MASFSLTQFLFAPIWGRLSDQYGRRPFILLSLFGSAVTYFSFGMAQSLTMLFIARLASGALTAASMPTSQAYITDITTPETRSSGMAALGAAFGLGFAFGPAIGGVMSKYAIWGLSPLATPAIFAAGMALVNAILAFFFLPESYTNRTQTSIIEPKKWYDAFKDVNAAMRNPRIGRPVLVFTYLTFAFAAIESCFTWLIILRFHDAIVQLAEKAYLLTNPTTAWANLTPEVQRGLIEKAQAGASSQIFLIVGVTILFTQGAVMGGLSRKIGDAKLVRFGLAVLTLSILGIAFAPSLLLIKVLSAGIAIGNGVSSPSLSALIMQFAGNEDRGVVSGAQHGLASAARVVAPPFNNYLVGVNTMIPFLISSVLMAISFVISLTLKSQPKGQEAPAEMPLAH